MATDPNQTIQDSRRAAMSFLDAAKKREERRNNRRPNFSGGRGGGVRGRNAVNNFLSAGQRNEARAAARQNGGEAPIDIADRIRQMSDEEFENAMKTGAITPEQLRQAGEYDWDVYMGDVWGETDLPEQLGEPTYDEFIADPEKWGHKRGLNDETDRAFDRYKRTVKQQ